MNTIKLQAYMAHQGIASRRKSEQMIAEGLVMVNQQLAQIGQRIDPEKDQVSVKGKSINSQAVSPRYYLVNKPVGVISTTSDELGRKTVVSLVPENKERLYPVGRLDQESEGLMLLTNDGQLAHTLTHPSFEIPKTYQVLVAGKPTYKAINHLRKGVRLKEGYTKPSDVEIIGKEKENTWLSITIHQGWNRQIRRMLERVGYDTKRLIRVEFGPFTLEQLNNKPFIQLTKEEIDTFITP